MADSRAKRRPLKLDPELTRQLDVAQGTGEPVEAVLMLRTATQQPAADPGDVRSAAQSVIERVQQEVGARPHAVNVLANLGMVVVAAGEPFVRKLLDQPEFASAVANEAVAAPPPAAPARKSRRKGAAGPG